MSRYIDADECVTVRLYDNEREEEYTERMTIAESLDHFTDEGCPQTIDAVNVVYGEWMHYIDGFGLNTIKCSACGIDFNTSDGYGWNYCPYCGASMTNTRI